MEKVNLFHLLLLLFLFLTFHFPQFLHVLYYLLKKFPLINQPLEILLSSFARISVQVTVVKEQNTGNELLVTSSDIQVTSSDLRVTSGNPRITSSNPRVTVFH